MSRGFAFWQAVQKALQHKYIRKYRKNGRWVYVYAEGDRHGSHAIAGHHLDVHDHHLHEGASFSAGSGQGHFKVLSHKDGKVTFHHDDIDGKGAKGETKTVSTEDFKKHVSGQHQDAAKSHAAKGLAKRESILEKAKVHGTEKHVARAEKELARWKELHKGHLDSDGSNGSDHGIFSAKDNAVDKLNNYMDATFNLRNEPDHSKAIEKYNAIVAAQKDFKAAHGMELSIPPKPKSKAEVKAQEKAQEKAKQDKEKAKAEKAKSEKARLDKIAASPDGWKEHLRDKGIDPDHPYLQEHGEKAQQMWDTWGVALQPPDRPAESKEDHEKLWSAMNKDMDSFMGAVDLGPLRDRVATSGLTFSLEGSIPLGEEHAESIGFESAAGIYRPDRKKLEVIPSAKAQHTFLHEFAHAMDHLSSEGKGFLSTNKDSELKKHLDALPEAHLPASLSKENLGYYKSDPERTARAMEHFLPALGLGVSSKLEGQSGHYSIAQMQEHADAFAGIAKELGFSIKAESLALFKNKEAYRKSERIKRSLGATKAPIAAKKTGHEWAAKAHNYAKEGKHAHAIAAIERAKKEHGATGYENPWHGPHLLITRAKELKDVDITAARAELKAGKS